MLLSRAVPRKLFASAALPAPILFLLLAATAPVCAAPTPPADLDRTELARLQISIFQIASASISQRAPGADPSSAAIGTSHGEAPASPPESEIADPELSAAPLAETLPADGEPAIDAPDDTTEKSPIVQTRLPGVSSDDLQRFKRQMFRRDI